VKYQVTIVDITLDLHKEADRFRNMISMLKGTPMLVVLDENEQGELYPAVDPITGEQIMAVIGGPPDWITTYNQYLEKYLDMFF